MGQEGPGSGVVLEERYSFGAGRAVGWTEVS